MKSEQAKFLVWLLLAALLGFGAGWLARGREDSLEQRTHRAVEHVRDAFRSRTR